MYGLRWLGVVLLSALILTSTGCRSGASKRASGTEPSLTLAPDADTPIAEAPQAKSVTYVDRHPMFSKPREYWENAGDNKIVKASAATFIGVPAGVYGELKQIVVGAPPTTR